MVRFTVVALAMTTAGWILGPDSHVWAVATCLLVGTALSFSVVPLLDASAYGRMAERNGWTMWEFHVGNAVLHYLPLAAVWYVSWPAQSDDVYDNAKRGQGSGEGRWQHGVAAAAVHFVWAMWHSRGTMCLDAMYVPLEPRHWAVLWAVALGSEVLTGRLV